jgi:hypothetical protein
VEELIVESFLEDNAEEGLESHERQSSVLQEVDQWSGDWSEG